MQHWQYPDLLPSPSVVLQMMQDCSLRQTRNRVVVLQVMLGMSQQEFSCQSLYQVLLRYQTPVPMSTLNASLHEFENVGLAQSRVICGERFYRIKPRYCGG